MGDMSRSRSSFKVKGQIEGNNLIFGIHMSHITPHILRGQRSRSFFKVKGQIEGHNLIFGIHVRHITLHILRGEMSRSRFELAIFSGSKDINCVNFFLYYDL